MYQFAATGEFPWNQFLFFKTLFKLHFSIFHQWLMQLILRLYNINVTKFYNIIIK